MLSEVPEGWGMCSLGEVISLEYGKSLPEKTRIKGDYPVYGSAGVVGTHNDYLIDSPSIVVGRKGTVGAVYKTSQPFFPIDTTYYVVARNAVNWDWLTALLASLQLAKLNEATGVPGLNRENAYKSEVLIPPLNEQHRIAEILSSVDASIQATQAVIEQAERVKRGLMEKLLTGGLGSGAVEHGQVPDGWIATTIGDACSIARGGSPRPIDTFMTDAEDGINWIKISDASASSKYIYTTKERIRPEGEKKSRRVKAGDFLLSNSMSFGRPYILRIDGCIHDGWLALTFDRKQLGEEFLYYLLSSPLVFKQFEAKAAGSAVKNLNKDLVSSVKIALPSFEEQERIAAILISVDDFITKQKSIIEQQTIIKNGLMDDLLTGKVRTI